MPMPEEPIRTQFRNVPIHARPNLEEEIRRHAFELYEERGREHGPTSRTGFAPKPRSSAPPYKPAPLSWWQQVPYFSERYACITFAHRGFSPSRITIGGVDTTLFEDDLLALMDHLKLDEVRLVAQSMGGRACLNVALHHPQRIRALVMASTGGAVDLKSLDAADRKSVESWLAVNGGKEAELRKRGIHPAAGERMAREQPALEFLYREIDRLSADLDKDALRQKLEANRRLSASELKTLKVPALFISGAEDVIFPPSAAAALAKLAPQGKLETVPETGHSVYFQRPEVFNRLVFNFFEMHRSHDA